MRRKLQLQVLEMRERVVHTNKTVKLDGGSLYATLKAGILREKL